MMTTYIVTFQTKSKLSREKVRKTLKTYDYYCPIHNYCWAIQTEEKAPQVRDKIKKVLAPGERVFIIRSGTESAWFNTYGEKNSNWLKENL